MDSGFNAGTNAGNEASVPVVRPGAHHQIIGVVVRRKRDKPLTVVHVDHLEAYRGTAMPAWMTTEQRKCLAV